MKWYYIGGFKEGVGTCVETSSLTVGNHGVSRRIAG